MNEDQINHIITLLEEIKSHLVNIENSTYDISSIESNTSETAQYLKSIKNNLR